jgi:uncharacterized protein involved in exopolysaccharide biosynthesis
MTEQAENKKATEADEIDLIEVFKKIWAGRKTIYKSVAVCFVLGLVIALGTPKEYKSEVTLLVETNAKGGGMSGLLQQFGGLAGINLSGAAGEDALSPTLYPDVIKSTPFLLEIMNQKVTESKYDSTLTVAQYLDRHTRPSLMVVVMGYTIGLPGKIIGWIKGNKKSEVESRKTENGPFRLSQKQTDIAGALSGLIKAKEGESNNTLVISVEVQDPVVAAQLTDSVVKSLTRYVIDYRTQKAKTDLKFIADRHAEAEANYIQAQEALAAYSDRNKNVVLASARIEEQRLQSEYNLAFNIYNTLSQQLEQAKIKVQENTPVFKVIDPAKVPLQKSKPKTSLIIIAMVFLGGFVGIGLIFGKIVFKNFKLSQPSV